MNYSVNSAGSCEPIPDRKMQSENMFARIDRQNQVTRDQLELLSRIINKISGGEVPKIEDAGGMGIFYLLSCMENMNAVLLDGLRAVCDMIGAEV